MNKVAILFSMVLFFFQAHSQTKIDSLNLDILHSVYLIGDVGDDTLLSQPTLALLKGFIESDDPLNSTVVFLGDNIYPEGLHKKSHELRLQDEQRINAQLDILKNYNGKIAFIPGNHDWKQGDDKGDNYVKIQEKYIEQYLNKGNVFLPSNGCPGPIEIELNDELVLLIIDTQWWIHRKDKPRGEQDDCSALNKTEFMAHFGDLLKSNRSKNILIAGHHPLFSNGHHGGKFQLKDHIFPLTSVNKNIYCPLPIIGSIYPYYRKMLGDKQDISNPIYQSLIENMLKKMNEYDNLVYAAGHEHNLQYFHKNSNHHIVSGSGSKSTYLRKNKQLEFGTEQRGFSKLLYYKNGEVWMEFYSPDVANETEPIYRKKLYTKKVISAKPIKHSKRSYKGEFRTVVPDSNFAASSIKRFFFGDLNRDLWTTPIKVPVLDINFEKGGLVPLQKGGGMQTKSLRLQGGDGHQYVLRTIKKDATFLVEKNLRNTVSQDIILDGIAGSHPYAAIVVPSLSDAVGIYHHNPKLVYVPADSALGDYLEEFGGSFCLFEERATKDMSKMKGFGGSDKVVNYSKAIEKVHGKYSHNVDYKYLVKARLFDMMIADWDRHDDQWRWATFKEGENTIYRPIPRDRDQVFFKFDGIVMKIANRKWALKKFQGFNPDIRDIRGQNFNARYFDRAFTTQASKQDWIDMAQAIQKEINDSLIESSIRQFPAAAFAHNGEFLIKTLKSRKEKLTEFAERYYKVLAKEVSIVGKLKDEYYEILRKDNGDVEVNIYPRKKGKKVVEKRYYHRVFKGKETKEIILYGLGGDDEYVITGKVKKSIVVRIVAGFDKDKFVDKSKVRGFRKKTRIYDTKKTKKKSIVKSKETITHLKPEEKTVVYNRRSFVYDQFIPVPSFGYNPDDGFFLGAGFIYTKQGFNKNRFKTRHKLLANYAIRSGAYNVKYNFIYTDLIGKWDLGSGVVIEEPLVYNIYNVGNESEDLFGKNNSSVRKEKYQFRPFIQRGSSDGLHNLILGGDIQQVSFESTKALETLFSPKPIRQTFMSAFIQYKLENKDDQVNPNRGVALSIELERTKSLTEDNINYSRMKSELSLYLPVNFILMNKATLALRSGFGQNFGDLEFYQENFIGGYKEFRGVRRNRFSGETSFYNNVDLRINLTRIKNYVLPFEVGLLMHYDLGKIWEPTEEKSNHWHTSKGGGVFFNVFDFIILKAVYSKSDVDDLIVVGTDFLF